MLEKNADFQIPEADIPDCFKDPDTRALLHLEDPYAANAAQACEDGLTYNPGAYRPKGIAFPNQNLVTAWNTWRGLYIQNQVLPKLMRAKINVAKAHDQIVVQQEENEALREQLRALLIENYRPPEAPAVPDVPQKVDVEMTRDRLLVTIFSTVKQFRADSNANPKHFGKIDKRSPKGFKSSDKSRAENLLVALTKPQSVEEILRVLSNFFSDRLNYFGAVKLNSKCLDTYIIEALRDAELLPLLINDFDQMKQDLNDEEGLGRVRGVLSERCRDYVAPVVQWEQPVVEEEYEGLDGFHYEPDLDRLYPRVDVEAADIVLPAVLPDIPDDIDIGGVQLPLDDENFDGIFCDPLDFEDYVAGEEKIFSDGITYSAGGALAISRAVELKINKEREEAERGDRDPVLDGIDMKGASNKKLDIDRYEALIFVRNSILFYALEPYEKQKKINIAYLALIKQVDPDFKAIDDPNLSYLLANQLEELENQLADGGPLEVQNQELQQAIYEEEQRQQELLDEEIAVVIEEEERPVRVVSCMEIAIAFRQAMANYQAKMDIANEVDIVPRSFFSRDNESHRIEKLIKKLVCATDMKEMLSFIYRHMHKQSLNGYTIHLDSSALDTYILVELKRTGLLGAIIGSQSISSLSLRTEDERHLIKTKLWKACDPDYVDCYSLERLNTDVSDYLGAAAGSCDIPAEGEQHGFAIPGY